MTVREILDIKYREAIGPKGWILTDRDLKRFKESAAAKKMHLAQYFYMCLSITEADIKANGGYRGELWAEIHTMHQQKLIASNQHKSDYRNPTKYWLTKKGFKALNENHCIC